MFKNYVLTCFVALLSFTARGEAPQYSTKEEVNIYKRVYDAPIETIKGEQTSLLRLTEREPLIVALIFTRCSNICYPFLLRLKEDLQFGNPRGRFNVAVVSFDPRDSKEDMERMAKGFGLDREPDWIFGITKEIDSLIRSIGFDILWDEARQQFDHDALLVGLNKDGRISKKLIGIRNTKDLNLLVSSINNVYAPTYRLPGQNLLFSCFNYDPETGKTTPGTGLLFLALPAVLTLLLLVGIRYGVRREK